MTTHKYETHLHTAETSKCALSSGPEFARFFKARGYSGIFVTDHFLNGNTTVPQNLPWPQRIDLFCRGYDAAAREGAAVGLDVFFAWEYSYGWAHFLTYGLDKQWLLDHPDLLDWHVLDYFDRVHADGGFIVHAHPFRENVDLVHLVPNKTDAVETINPNRPDLANYQAQQFAAAFNLPQTAGSDIHATNQSRLAGITTTHRLTHARDYLPALISGQATPFDETTT